MYGVILRLDSQDPEEAANTLARYTRSTLLHHDSVVFVGQWSVSNSISTECRYKSTNSDRQVQISCFGLADIGPTLFAKSTVTEA